ncbi:Alpha/Beta hydrolase protein [Flagelloscypha sp. PMI_526]|nr:Alpha/Beta hydrolase protein [Flagelloscypha sp. PMI_526]
MASTTTTEQFLTLQDGRTLAYDASGNPSSKSVVLYFHGAMTVGTANPPPGNVAQKDVHFIAPTLPGWGLTSPRPSGVPFHTVVRRDTTALLSHLHPDMATNSEYKLYISGGSYGSVPTQIIYGSSLDEFPQRDRIVGMLILGGFVPLYKVPDYGKHMTTANYLSIGPVAYNSPFKILPRIAAWGIGMQVSTPEKGAAFIKGFMFDKMSEEEKDTIVKEKGEPMEEIIKAMGLNVYQSIHKTNAGFVDISIAANADWGLREEIFKSPAGSSQHYPGFARVLIAGAKGDDMAPFAFSEWNAANYKNGELLAFEGGHLGVMGHMKEIFDKFLDE